MDEGVGPADPADSGGDSERARCGAGERGDVERGRVVSVRRRLPSDAVPPRWAASAQRDGASGRPDACRLGVGWLDHRRGAGRGLDRPRLPAGSRVAPGSPTKYEQLVEKPIFDLAGHTIDVRAVLTGLRPGRIARKVERSYDRRLFHGATLQDLPDDGPPTRPRRAPVHHPRHQPQQRHALALLAALHARLADATREQPDGAAGAGRGGQFGLPARAVTRHVDPAGRHRADADRRWRLRQPRAGADRQTLSDRLRQRRRRHVPRAETSTHGLAARHRPRVEHHRRPGASAPSPPSGRCAR